MSIQVEERGRKHRSASKERSGHTSTRHKRDHDRDRDRERDKERTRDRGHERDREERQDGHRDKRRRSENLSSEQQEAQQKEKREAEMAELDDEMEKRRQRMKVSPVDPGAMGLSCLHLLPASSGIRDLVAMANAVLRSEHPLYVSTAGFKGGHSHMYFLLAQAIASLQSTCSTVKLLIEVEYGLLLRDWLMDVGMAVAIVEPRST